MTAIKKSTSKTTKSPAPATKAAAVPAPASKSAAAPAKAPMKKKISEATPAPAARATTQAPVSVAKPSSATVVSTPTIKAIGTKKVATVITARIDIGFGNLLHVRGEGPGLSWDKGVAMNCRGGDHWELTLSDAARPYVFKFLVNDLSWSTGTDYTVAAGQSVALTPEF